MAPKLLRRGVAETISADGMDVTSDVTITPQHDNISYTIEPRGSSRSNKDLPDGTPHGDASFQPGRVIINLKLAMQGAAPTGPLVRLRTKILQKDVDRAQGKLFKLAHWDQTAHRWVIMKDNIPCAVGDVEADFSKLGDPPIGVGP